METYWWKRASMSLRHTKIRKNPKTFQRLFGVTPQEFEIILKKVEPLWQKRVISGYKRPFATINWTFQAWFWCFCCIIEAVWRKFWVYVWDRRCARVPPYPKAWSDFGERHGDPKRQKIVQRRGGKSHDRCDRTPHRTGPKSAQNLAIPARNSAMRLKRKFAWHKKGASFTPQNHPGSVHDFTVFKGEKRPPKDSWLFVDSGYQGIADIHPNADFPYKSSKNKPLDVDEKACNTALSRLRVTVENIFSQLKTFKILSDRCRNKRRHYGITFNIIAGIVNLKNGFGAP